MQLVEDKSKILFSKAALLEQGNVQTINWSQSFSSKTEKFVQITATLATDKTSKVVFFVQQPLVDKLLSTSKPTAEGGDEYEAVVQAPAFRYGQDSATKTTFRFLVYVDPSYNIFQHRFLNQNTVSKLAALANKMPDLNPCLSAAKSLIGVAQSVFGDPLRSFEG